MSGIYNYHPTISSQNIYYPATDSQQVPFYFGGAQVPVSFNPGVPTIGFGIYKNSLIGKQDSSFHKEGRGIKTSYDRNFNIAMPKLLSRK